MYKNLIFTVLDSEKGLQFNTQCSKTALDLWFGYETPCHLIHRECGESLPVLGEWVPATIKLVETLPERFPASDVQPEYYFEDYPEDHISWEDEEADVQLEEKYL